MSGKLSKRLISLAVVLSLIVPSTSQIARADEDENENDVATTDIVFGTAYPMTGVSSPGMSSYYKELMLTSHM